VRVPHPVKPGRRVQEVHEYTTMTAGLLCLADWLEGQRVELVAMEATSVIRGNEDQRRCCRR
jgi:hypothetical protein